MDPTDRIPAPARSAPDLPHHTRLRARTPDDIAAFVPLALGFVPERSVVLVSVGAVGMHARVDLPHDPDDVDDVVEALLRPARLNGVDEVVAVVYDDDTTVADEAAWSIHEEFTAAGVGVREVLRVHDDHWYAVLPGAPLEAYHGVRFTLAEHRFTAQGVFDGRVTHASREALRATIAPDAAAAQVVGPALADATALPAGAVAALVRRHLERATSFSDRELASVAISVVAGDRRDEAWVWLIRAEARRAVDLWSDAVRRLPATHVAGPAAVPCWASPRGWSATARSPGAPSTGAARWCPTTRWPVSSRSCSSPRPRPTPGRRCGRGSGARRTPPRDQPLRMVPAVCSRD